MKVRKSVIYGILWVLFLFALALMEYIQDVKFN